MSLSNALPLANGSYAIRHVLHYQTCMHQAYISSDTEDPVQAFNCREYFGIPDVWNVTRSENGSYVIQQNNTGEYLTTDPNSNDSDSSLVTYMSTIRPPTPYQWIIMQSRTSFGMRIMTANSDNPDKCVTLNNIDQPENGTTSGISMNLANCTKGDYNGNNNNQDWLFESLIDFNPST